jgi:hypothetical protein
MMKPIRVSGNLSKPKGLLDIFKSLQKYKD